MPPLLIAHRGDSAHAPENTIPAFEQAVAKGADWIELDLTLSSDDEVVVCHDATLWRRARSRKRLRSLTAAELARVDVSRGFPAFAPTGVPRLGEVLDSVGIAIPLYLELKSPGGGRRNPMARRLLERCLAHVPRSSGHALASFDAGLVRGVIEAGRRAVLILKDPSAFFGMSPLHRRGLYAVSVRHDVLRPDFVEHVTRERLRLWVWTVDEEKAISRALDRGAHGICGNDVARARAVLNKLAEIRT
jgi:glycerophosphoryl diester phosphodiesterase